MVTQRRFNMVGFHVLCDEITCRVFAILLEAHSCPYLNSCASPRGHCLVVLQRITTNCSFFATNYIIICVLCCAFFILRSPGLLVILLVSLCMFLYVFMSRKKPVVVMDYTLGTREKAIAAAIGELWACDKH